MRRRELLNFLGGWNFWFLLVMGFGLLGCASEAILSALCRKIAEGAGLLGLMSNFVVLAPASVADRLRPHPSVPVCLRVSKFTQQ